MYFRALDSVREMLLEAGAVDSVDARVVSLSGFSIMYGFTTFEDFICIFYE